jgi:hypothetical protein
MMSWKNWVLPGMTMKRAIGHVGMKLTFFKYFPITDIRNK